MNTKTNAEIIAKLLELPNLIAKTGLKELKIPKIFLLIKT